MKTVPDSYVSIYRIKHLAWNDYTYACTCTRAHRHLYIATSQDLNT